MIPAPSQLRGIVAAAIIAVGGAAGAASLQVAPTGLEFLPSSPAQGLWLTNTGTAALNAQVRVFRWTQVGGKDVLTPSRSMVASPPMVELTPGAKQLVRVILVGERNPDAAPEAYRVLVDELPPPADEAETGVRYVLRHSVPAFVIPSTVSNNAEVAAALSWRVVDDGHGVALQAHNNSAFRAQLSQVSLLPPGEAPLEVSAGLLGYVLPGMTMRWPLKFTPAQLPAGTRLRASLNGKPVDQAIAIGDLAH